MISAGIDCGAKTAKVVVIKDGKIIGKARVLSGFDQKKSILEAWDLALKNARVSADDVNRIGGTGSGKNAVKFALPRPGTWSTTSRPWPRGEFLLPQGKDRGGRGR